MALIDYEKAFDSVQTAALLKELKDQRLEKTYKRLLDDIYKVCTRRKTLHNQSDKFPIEKEVRQGDPISPKLFPACLEGVFRRLDWENTGLRINREYLRHLSFADGIVLLSETAEHLRKKLEELQ